MSLPRRVVPWALVASAAACIALVAANRPLSHPDYFGTIAPGHPPTELWTNLGSGPEWIDPGKCSDAAGSEVIWNLFAGLTQAHPSTLEPIPDLAESWDVSEDGRTYTFHLRESHWSDGRPVTAHDFDWSWRRVLDPKTASKYAEMLYPVVNAAPYNQRALVVEGLGGAAGQTGESDVVDLAALRAAFEAVVPVETVTLAAHQGEPQAYVVVGGEDGERAANRQRAIDALDGQSVAGTTVQVSVSDGSRVGFKATDDRTFVVELTSPIPYFLYTTNFYTLMPVPRHVIERLEAAGQSTNLWTRTENIVTSGAYTLSEWKFRQYMWLDRNPHYWDAESVRLERVKLAMVESYNTTLNLYRAGEMDWNGRNTSLPAEFMDHLATFKDFRRDPVLTIYFYWVNTKAKPLDDKRVRQALSLAIDRVAIVTHVTRAGQVPTADLIPDGLAGYRGLGRPLFDPIRARELLREAGFEDGKDLPEVTLTYNTSEGHKQIAEAVQQMWKQNLGISVTLENQEWKVFLKNLQLVNFQVARLGWIGDYPDPNTFLQSLFTSHSGNNHSNWKNPEFDKLVADANAQSDPQRRLAMLREAEQMVMDEQLVIPFYIYTTSSMIKPFVRGLYPNFQDRHPFKHMWIDERWYDGVPGDADE